MGNEDFDRKVCLPCRLLVSKETSSFKISVSLFKKILKLTLVNTTYKGSAKFEATVDLYPAYPSLLSKKRSLVFLSVICTPCL